MTDTIAMSEPLLIWIASLIAGLIGAFFTFCVHLLINMNGKLDKVVIADVQHDARLVVLERHDKANREESTGLLAYLRHQEGKI